MVETDLSFKLPDEWNLLGVPAINTCVPAGNCC